MTCIRHIGKIDATLRRQGGYASAEPILHLRRSDPTRTSSSVPSFRLDAARLNLICLFLKPVELPSKLPSRKMATISTKCSPTKTCASVKKPILKMPYKPPTGKSMAQAGPPNSSASNPPRSSPASKKWGSRRPNRFVPLLECKI